MRGDDSNAITGLQFFGLDSIGNAIFDKKENISKYDQFTQTKLFAANSRGIAPLTGVASEDYDSCWNKCDERYQGRAKVKHKIEVAFDVTVGSTAFLAGPTMMVRIMGLYGVYGALNKHSDWIRDRNNCYDDCNNSYKKDLLFAESIKESEDRIRRENMAARLWEIDKDNNIERERREEMDRVDRRERDRREENDRRERERREREDDERREKERREKERKEDEERIEKERRERERDEQERRNGLFADLNSGRFSDTWRESRIIESSHERRFTVTTIDENEYWNKDDKSVSKLVALFRVNPFEFIGSAPYVYVLESDVYIDDGSSSDPIDVVRCFDGVPLIEDHDPAPSPFDYKEYLREKDMRVIYPMPNWGF